MFNKKKNFNDPRKKKMSLFVVGEPEQIKRLLSQHKNTFDANELISTLAIEIWRLEKRIEKIKDLIIGATEENSNSVLDQLQRLKDILKRQEIEIHEHTGEKYNEGMSIKALHFENVLDLPPGEMKIIETIKPSVYFKGQIIYHGEVIVGKGK